MQNIDLEYLSLCIDNIFSKLEQESNKKTWAHKLDMIEYMFFLGWSQKRENFSNPQLDFFSCSTTWHKSWEDGKPTNYGQYLPEGWE